MRFVLGIALIVLLLAACTRLAEASAAGKETIEFERDVQPILERRCQPCHFPGGKMHEELPFDRAATIVKLGEKLFTRIKAEEERMTIRKFLADQRR